MRSIINSTGRRKIDAGMAAFAVSTHDDGVVDFAADLDLSQLELPGDARILVEAYRQSLHERFSFGTIGHCAPPASTKLNELSADQLRFRIKVIEPETGCILALGDKFGASEADEVGRTSLLKVVVRDIGQEPWKTEMGDEERPVLVLNSNIPNARHRIRDDPFFKALVLPGALRQVLMRLWVAQAEDIPDDETLWTNQWIRYAEKLSGDEKPDWSQVAAVEEWIDKVCHAFASEFGLLNMIPEGD